MGDGERMSHLDEQGRARMVDVGDKESTRRRAVATAGLTMTARTADALFGGELPKGDAVATARIAGIMAAKKTPDLIPLCHPLALTSVTVDIRRTDTGAMVEAAAETTGPTGVEMEAMTAAAVAALAIYDMVKGLERGVTVNEVRLIEKSGGRSGTWRAES